MPTDVIDLPAGAALDALVAVQVMGYQRLPDSVDGIVVHRLYRSPAGMETSWLPAFSANIAHAWEVVERITSAGHDFTVDLTRPSAWRAWTNMPKGRGAEAEADTAPLAICRAALAAAKG